MNLFEIVINDPKVQEWFKFLYNHGVLDETVERIAKYYIDFCLAVNEKELEKYFDIVPYNDIFQKKSEENIPLPFPYKINL